MRKNENLAGGAIADMLINDEKVGEVDIEVTVPLAFSGHETFDIGRDTGLPVDMEYFDKGDFPFTGLIKQIIFDVKPNEFGETNQILFDL